FFIVANLGDEGLTFSQIELTFNGNLALVKIVVITDAITFVLQSINHDAALLITVTNIYMATIIVIVTCFGSHTTCKAVSRYWVSNKVNHAADSLWAVKNLTRTLDHFNTLHSFQRCREMCGWVSIWCQEEWHAVFKQQGP